MSKTKEKESIGSMLADFLITKVVKKKPKKKKKFLLF